MRRAHILIAEPLVKKLGKPLYRVFYESFGKHTAFLSEERIMATDV